MISWGANFIYNELRRASTVAVLAISVLVRHDKRRPEAARGMGAAAA